MEIREGTQGKNLEQKPWKQAGYWVTLRLTLSLAFLYISDKSRWKHIDV